MGTMQTSTHIVKTGTAEVVGVALYFEAANGWLFVSPRGGRKDDTIYATRKAAVESHLAEGLEAITTDEIIKRVKKGVSTNG